MRSFYLLLLAVIVLLAYSNAAMLEDDSALQSVNRDGDTKRTLRVETTSESDDDEERLLGINSFKLWRLRRAANKLSKQQAKLAASQAKLAAKQEKMLKSWLENKKVYPDYLYKKLGFAKMGAKASESPNYAVYQKYVDELTTRWVNFGDSPETVYKSLRLDKLGAKASQSPSYPIYEKFLRLIFSN
ncbi:unnamed protein product [Phytophthora lilii]|uniref:RxLR effector protein n=1 Tax=Phytophthora lilii TaxID=2077276 RepID=A0A9W6WZP0_9STRA|nr:unnamed protein product [Phytophthora lilii]